ncbi:MAG: nitroreductase family protein [Promethearchaeota archaeon]
MDALEAIFTRRSVRKYLPKPIPDDLVEKLLKAAMLAPSAHNEQAWQFIVVKDPAIKNQIPKFQPFTKLVEGAPLVIVVCGDTSLEDKDSEGFWPTGCSAATENLLIAAHALGLGAVWTAVWPVKDFIEGAQKLFKLPSHVIPIAMIPIGYPDQIRHQPHRFNPERVHYNHW